MIKTVFSRKEALLWCWKNIRHKYNCIPYDTVQSYISKIITDELLNMGFITREWNERRMYAEYYLTDLGKRYCEDLFE
jgi:predicted transcriptional regulator